MLGSGHFTLPLHDSEPVFYTPPSSKRSSTSDANNMEDFVYIKVPAHVATKLAAKGAGTPVTPANAELHQAINGPSAPHGLGVSAPYNDEINSYKDVYNSKMADRASRETTLATPLNEWARPLQAPNAFGMLGRARKCRVAGSVSKTGGVKTVGAGLDPTVPSGLSSELARLNLPSSLMCRPTTDDVTNFEARSHRVLNKPHEKQTGDAVHEYGPWFLPRSYDLHVSTPASARNNGNASTLPHSTECDNTDENAEYWKDRVALPIPAAGGNYKSVHWGADEGALERDDDWNTLDALTGFENEIDTTRYAYKAQKTAPEIATSTPAKTTKTAPPHVPDETMSWLGNTPSEFSFSQVSSNTSDNDVLPHWDSNEPFKPLEDVAESLRNKQKKAQKEVREDRYPKSKEETSLRERIAELKKVSARKLQEDKNIGNAWEAACTELRGETLDLGFCSRCSRGCDKCCSFNELGAMRQRDSDPITGGDDHGHVVKPIGSADVSSEWNPKESSVRLGHDRTAKKGSNLDNPTEALACLGLGSRRGYSRNQFHLAFEDRLQHGPRSIPEYVQAFETVLLNYRFDRSVPEGLTPSTFDRKGLVSTAGKENHIRLNHQGVAEKAYESDDWGQVYECVECGHSVDYCCCFRSGEECVDNTPPGSVRVGCQVPRSTVDERSSDGHSWDCDKTTHGLKVRSDRKTEPDLRDANALSGEDKFIQKEPTVTYHATIEHGDQTLNIPIREDNVSGQEKAVITSTLNFVSQWTQRQELRNLFKLQDTFDVAKLLYVRKEEKVRDREQSEDGEARLFTPPSPTTPGASQARGLPVFSRTGSAASFYDHRPFSGSAQQFDPWG